MGSEVGSTTANDIFFPSAGYNLNFIIDIAVTNTSLTGSGQTIIDSLGVQESRKTGLALYYKIDAALAEYLRGSRDNFASL